MIESRLSRWLLGWLLLTPFGGVLGAVTSVTVDQAQVVILGSASGAGMSLVEVWPNGEVVGSTEVKTGEFELALPRLVEGRDRIFSAWKLGDEPLVYPTDVAAAAAYPNLKPLKVDSIKGMGGIHPDPRLFSDLVELGVKHITVNIIVSAKFSPAQVAQLDGVLSFADKNGIVVTAILLVPPRGSVVSHPNCDPQANYSLANMTSKEGVDAYAKSVSFLAERYCKPGAPHGRITHWIVGNEVDSGWIWTNAGEKTANEYMDEYCRVMRVTYYSVRKFDPNGKVFISLTHYWNSQHQPDPKRFYKPRRLLHLLREHCERSGDFEWGLAYHPYAQGLFNPKTWEDKLAQDTLETPLITMKNIELLDQFMRQPAFLYQGKRVRSIVLSEQGYHTKDESAEAQALQAAAIVYAWEKMKPLKSIEAFHYHRWIDHEREGGLNLGLWTVKKGSITWPETKKRSWAVYQALGTEREAEATAFAREIYSRK